MSVLPDEILEAIFLKLTPYKDLNNCKLVSRQWNRVAQDAKRFIVHKLYGGLRGSSLLHCTYESHDICPAKRISVATCVVDDVLFAFGGSYANPGPNGNGLTAFNDLWRLSLNTRKWERLIPTGQYPRPKCRARMIHYKRKLILFGGTISTVTPPQYRNTEDVNELHMFCLDTCRWISDCRSVETPPKLSMYGISEHKGILVITGGENDTGVGRFPNNDVWCFNIEEGRWFTPPLSDTRPRARTGHTQVKLDDDHLLIIGGSAVVTRNSPNSNGPPFNDCWMLDMSESTWKWVELKIESPENAPPVCGSHRGCQVGDFLVFLHPKFSLNVGEHRCYRATAPRDSGFHDRLQRQLERNRNQQELNINGQRGELRREIIHPANRNGPYPVIYPTQKNTLPSELLKPGFRDYIAYSLDTSEAVSTHAVRWWKSQPFSCSESFPVRGFTVEYGVGEIVITCGQARTNYFNGSEQQERTYFIAYKNVLS